MCPLLKLGVLLQVVVVVLITAGTADKDVKCANSGTGYSLPCNRELDPWQDKRKKMADLTSGINEEEDLSKWARFEAGSEVVDQIVTIHDSIKTISEIGEEAKEAKEEIEKAAESMTETAEVLTKKSKGIKNILQKGAKVLGALSTAVQFLGPIMDIYSLFAPVVKSDELVAIESGFAKIGAKIDSVSYQLDKIEGALEWNAIVNTLMEFEANVGFTMKKYKQLAEEIQAIDPSKALPLIVKSHIEDLVDAIKSPAAIGNRLHLVDNLFKGKSEFTTGSKTLLKMFIEAVDNDCSRIFPMSNKLTKLVKDAQLLQFFYEVNQKLIKPDDDKGYPKMIYDMYRQTVIQYTKCTNGADSNAQKKMQVSYGNGEKLTDIIDKLERKYELYNWVAMKESDKEEEHFALINNSPRQMEVKLNGLSEDEQKKQSLTLFAVRMASKAEVEDAIGRVKLILVSLKKDDLPKFKMDKDMDDWKDSQKFRVDILNEVRNIFKKDKTLESLIDQQKMTMVMFKNDTKIDLYGWHYKSNMEILISVHSCYNCSEITDNILGFTLGFSFNFARDTRAFSCINGYRIDMSFDFSVPYCLCNINYGGETCEILLNNSPQSTLSGSVMNMVQKYKVPGMFDLQDNIKRGTDKVLQEMEDNKLEIFNAIGRTGVEIIKSKNAILSAQSIMLNDLKADNARLLSEFSGLGEAMEAAFEKERNDRIYRTEKGQKVMIQTISEANKEVTSRIKSLTGKVIENRYFKELKLKIPIYQRKFERAVKFGGVAELLFSKYLTNNEEAFQVCKESVKNAIVQKSDSFIMARMQISMISGCTDDYTRQIRSTWAELMQLHLALNTMELWDLDYKIKMSQEQAFIDFYMDEKVVLQTKAKSDTDKFKEVYKSRSCPAFSMSDLLGGGCGASITYPGQSVPMQCSDPKKSLVLLSTGDIISDVVCQSDSSWAVIVDDLACVYKCIDAFDDQEYEIGEIKKLSAAPVGFYFADTYGNAVTESTCLAQIPPQASEKIIELVSASQSSTALTGTANNAIDGNTAGDFSLNSCTQTDAATNSWWMANLVMKSAVSKVIIHNRKDCCFERINGAKVYVDDVYCGEVIYEAGKTVYKVGCGGIIGERVKVVQEFLPLALCEVQVQIQLNSKISGCFQHDTDFYSADLKDMIVSSDQECIRKCKEEVQCKAITYRKSDGMCWLKTKENGDRISQNPGITSANVKCFKDPSFAFDNTVELVSSSQSSTVLNGVASRAIDGNTAGDFELNSCTQTDAATNSWWMADLVVKSSVSKVIIHNREDCCFERINGAKVYVGDVYCGEVVYEIGKTVYKVECGGIIGESVKVVQEVEPLTLCEVQVEIRASEKTIELVSASQSSTAWTGTASNAIDGNTDGDFSKNSCTQTDANTNSWWMANLVMKSAVSKVIIHNRKDCCFERINGAKVYVGDVYCGEVVYEIGKTVYKVECGGIIGESVKVVQEVEPLTLCEVQVEIQGPKELHGIWSKTTLTDVDECATSGFCGFGGICTNYASNFVCTCPSGYSDGSDGKCADVNECNFGMVGYNKCLLQGSLGACENTDGSYRCTCFAGAYKNPHLAGKECIACNCHKNGVTSSICDGNTGVCLCNPNVAGTECGVCKTGHTNFPFCNKCAAGYYEFPNCVKCSCEDTGVTAQYCNPNNGQCQCRENVAGSKCDNCKVHYESFPTCTPVVKDGTLSAWGAWTNWNAQQSCGQSFIKGYYEKRKRTRTCDDSTKNIHGRSCHGDNLLETETKFRDVCRQVTTLWIEVYDSFDAGTTADLWMGIRQGSNECTTHQPTWDAPNRDLKYWRNGLNGCTKTFDMNKPVGLYLYSDSSNAVYIRSMGVIIADKKKGWWGNPYKEIEKKQNNGWYTAG